MMKHEFEELAGYEVTAEDYNKIIEPMYMALPDVTKQEFVKMIDRKRFALPTRKQIVNQMKKIAQYCAEMCEHKSCWKEEQELERIAHEYAKRFYGLHWSDDIKVYAFFNREYAYPEIGRGCTYPKELVIGYGNTDYERITLV